jgi:hypothetical protein
MWVLLVVTFGVFYFVLHAAAKKVLAASFPSVWNKLDTKTRHEFANRVNSMVNAILTSTLSVYAVWFAKWTPDELFVNFLFLL